MSREILSSSHELIAKGSIDAEAEQLVIAAYRMAKGKVLSRMELYTRAQDRFPEDAGDRLLRLAGSRAEGKSLQHLTGTQFFLNHEYEVGPDVLVPRPETEFLVSRALEVLRRQPVPPVLGLEVGLGSGAISVELLSELPTLRMIASELTPQAEARAQSNAQRILGSEKNRLRIVRAGSALEVMQPFVQVLGELRAEFIISNPPYLTSTDDIEEEVRKNEPHTALFAPESDPLHFYREIAIHAERYLRPAGLAFLELASERASAVLELFLSSGWTAQLLKDLTSRDRVLFASWIGKS